MKNAAIIIITCTKGQEVLKQKKYLMKQFPKGKSIMDM